MLPDMTAETTNTEGGKDATTVKQPEDLDGSEAHALAERLDALSNRIGLDVSELSSAIEHGEEITEEEIEEIRVSLRRVEETLDTLTEPEQPEEIPLRLRAYGTRREALPLGDLDPESTERLIEAPVEEVSWLLNSDLREIEEITQRVDHNLRSGRLLDHHVGELWNCADRLRSWATDVLNHRLDGKVIMEREETRDRLSEEQLIRLGLIEEGEAVEEISESSIEQEPNTFGAPLGYE